MVAHFGDYDTTETVHIPFNTFTSDNPSASVTVTNLAAGDIEIHKDGSVTQRSSDAGVTVSIDFDGITGNHMVHIDLSDNTDAGFYAAGSRYQVRLEGITVDGATLNVWIGTFSIGCTLRPTTAGNKLDVTATGAAGIDWGNVENKTTANDLSATDIQLCDTVTTNSDMRGTDSAALASVCTEARLAELDAANLPTDIADIPTVAEFEARTLPSADYVVTTDTIAGVTTVTNLTNSPVNGDLTSTMKTSIAQYTGYKLGAVWFDTGGAAGAVSYVNGIITNPCSSPVNTHTLLTNLNLKVVRVVNGSTYTLEATYSGYSWIGEKWTLNCSGQNITNCYFEGATVSGATSAAGTGNQFTKCQIGTTTMAAGATQVSAATFRECGLTGTFTIGAAGIFSFENCYSEVSAGGNWVLDFAGVGATSINISNFAGSIEVQNMAAGDVLLVDGSGHITLTAPCAGTMYVRGNFELTPGAATTAITDTSRWNEEQQLALVTLVTTVTTLTGHTAQTGDSFARIGAAGVGLTEAGGDGDHLTAINLPNQTMDITGDITGNLSGSVGSVTGAVGSVTGNVGGNVTGSVGSVVGAVGSVTGAVGSVAGNVDGNVTGSVGSNLELGPAEVNAEVVDALATDTYAEPGQGAPLATTSLAAKLNYLYKAWRNDKVQNATSFELYNDAGTVVDQKSAVSDDGADSTFGKIISGP